MRCHVNANFIFCRLARPLRKINVFNVKQKLIPCKALVHTI